MKLSSTILVLFLVAIVSFAQEPLFTDQPTLVKTGSSEWTVEFSLNRFCDVAVSIINISDSTVIRHLAGGMLGSKAPAPLIRDSLHQKLVWDGKNDFGQLVSVPDNVVRVRVRAGMGARLVSMVGGNPYYFFTTPTYSSSIMGHGTMQGIVVGKDGSVYVCGAPGPFRHQHWFGNLYVIRQYDKNGDYVKTVYPFPSNLPIEKAKGWGVTEFPDGTYSPKNVNTSMI
ncbi:MAG: hypothetical protein JNL74_20675, partial [Fibrobacteres bacterium]|nr:hypothetical protein [Fibrobacterota bacterium]